MTDMRINGASLNQGLPQIKSEEQKPDGIFDDMMKEAMEKISQVQSDADQAVKELTSGKDPSEAIITMEKADMNFQLMIEVRNKLISAYQTIMNMQV